METLNINQEFTQVKFLHMVRVVKQYLSNKYKEEANKGVTIPSFMLDGMVECRVLAEIKDMLEHGSFLNMYNEAYYFIGESLT